MTAVFIPDALDDPRIVEIMEERARLGVDAYDEVWEGVLHMAPAPHAKHGALVVWFSAVLHEQCRRHALGCAYAPLNIRRPGTPLNGPRADFRIPDVALVPPDLVASTNESGVVEDGALLVVEVRSPREEFQKKLAFYAERRVAEALYVDRTTLAVELFRLVAGAWVVVSPDEKGWVESRTSHLRVRRVEGPDGAPSLEMVDARGGPPLPPR
jgi:Uma2 family endonuclease